MSRLGETIKAARVKAGMTEKALGKKCGFTESVVRDIEAGRRIASDDQARRILKVLGVENPVSTELEVAAEPEVKLRPRPRPYVLPLPEEAPAKNVKEEETRAESNDAWMDALSGVVRRVPIMDAEGLVIDHLLEPVTGGKIEGGAPDKVFYYRCPDDSLRGYRIHAGDLLLVVPCGTVSDEAVMLIRHKGERLARKVMKLDGGKLLLQSYDREFQSEKVELKDVLVIGRCVKLQRRL